MEDGILQLLPTRGLDQSILIAVLIGMFALLWLTETFGWVFVGLVVPGYLASVLVIEPAAGVAVLVEAVLTFVLVRLLSETLSRTTAWSPFFGRGRFFLIVLVSVVVRQHSELWLIPLAMEHVGGPLGLDVASVEQYASIGLVLVPLVANMFWKLDVPRGLMQVAVPTAITYAALVWVLLPYTNLSFSSLELTYENVALDFLASPKSYVILLCGALLAARFNLLYGWDYNGILVPSLLALIWLEPWAVAATLAEALILYVASAAVLAAPLLRTVNLEGPRKVVLVFTLGFLLKLALAFAIGDRWPGLKLTDLFGFGYVLTSLIAVKMLQKRIVGRVLLPIVVVSLVAFVSGSLVGYALEQIAPARIDEHVAPGDGPRSATIPRDPLGAMALASARARRELPLHLRDGRPGHVLGAYARLWRRIDRWLDAPSIDDAGDDPAEIAAAAAQLGLALTPLLGGGYTLLEREERLLHQTGWDSAVLLPGRPGPVLTVPRPRAHRPVAEAAAILCERLSCRAILVSGTDAFPGEGSAAAALEHPRASFAVAHRQLRSAAVIQLLAGDGPAALHLRHTVPPSVDLRALWPSALALRWDGPPGPVQQWGERGDVLVLRASIPAWRELLGAAAPPIERAVAPPGAVLAGAMSAGGPAVWPSESELLVLDELVVGRLLDGRPWAVRAAGLLASRAGLRVVEVADGPGRAWALVPTGGAGWLTVLARPGARALGIEVPHPRSEPGTWRLGLELWRRTGARVLMVASEPGSTAPPWGDPTRVGNLATPLQAGHQALVRALRDAPDALVISLRGFASWREIDADVVVGMGPPILADAQLPAALRALLADPLLGEGTRAHADGRRERIDLAGQGTPQLAHARAVGGVDFALVWTSMALRQRFADGARADADEVARVLGVAVRDQPVEGLLAGAGPDGAGSLAPLVADAERFARTGNRHLGRALARRARGALHVGFDVDRALPYLAVTVGRARAVVSLAEHAQACPAGIPVAESLARRCRVVGGAP